MKGVNLLALAVDRNLEHFISGAGGLGDFEELSHAVDRAGLALVLEALDFGCGTGSIRGSDYTAFLEEVDFLWRNPGNQIGNFADLLVKMSYRLLLVGYVEAFPCRFVMEHSISELPYQRDLIPASGKHRTGLSRWPLPLENPPQMLRPDEVVAHVFVIKNVLPCGKIRF